MAEGGAREAPPLPEEQLTTEACLGGRSRFFWGGGSVTRIHLHSTDGTP